MVRESVRVELKLPQLDVMEALIEVDDRFPERVIPYVTSHGSLVTGCTGSSSFKNRASINSYVRDTTPNHLVGPNKLASGLTNGLPCTASKCLPVVWFDSTGGGRMK